MFPESAKSQADANTRGALLYVGGFVLPDKNAAAQRVVGIAKAARDAGYKIVFLNFSPDCEEPHQIEYFGFECFECPQKEWDVARVDIDRVIDVCARIEGLKGIIAYNYPAPALSRLLGYCKANHLKCVGDVTEWYSIADVSFIKKLPKGIDIAWRMRSLNNKCDGLIVISDFLEEHYSGRTSVNIPPLVDCSDEKWPQIAKPDDEVVRLIYAGVPSKTKERLDLICDAVLALSNDCEIVLDIVGITSADYASIYGQGLKENACIKFHGRVEHKTVLEMVAGSTYSIIVRDDNRVTRAGFPTKFAESIACGTPVITNDNSCLEKYLHGGQCGYLVREDSLADDLRAIFAKEVIAPNTRMFDYRNYADAIGNFLNEVLAEEWMSRGHREG